MTTRSSVVLLASTADVELVEALSGEFDVLLTTSMAQLDELLENDWVKVAVIEPAAAELQRIECLQGLYPQLQWVVRGTGDEFSLRGAFAVLPLTVHETALCSIVRAAVRLFDTQREVERLGVELELRPRNINQAMMAQRQAAKARFRWDHGLVCDPAGPMGAVLETLRKTAPFDVSVLIQGESGTGKELCARALHQSSLRQDGPWVAVNCAAIPDDLLESELFGHRKGAFTHATHDHPGLFQQADGGTLFLDEIGEMSMRMQSKLLRVLQEKCLRPVGAVEDVLVDVRVVAACNRNLRQCVSDGEFRQDLYFRLATVQIDIPPLRERRSDVPLIADYLLQRNAEGLGVSCSGVSADIAAALAHLDWPGNVRELENELVRAIIQCESDTLSFSDFGGKLRTSPTAVVPAAPHTLTLRQRIEKVEHEAIDQALARHNGNKSAAAAELGLSRVGLRNKLERRDRARAAS